MKRFITAFAVCLGALVILNAATYVFLARSDGVHTYLRIGLPLKFVREGPGYHRFSPTALGADLVFALWLSYRVGCWWEHRVPPDYLIGSKT